MHKEKEITIGERKITARDISPKDIDKLLAGGTERQAGDGIGPLLGSDLTTEAVGMSTGIAVDDLLTDFSLEELAEIWTAVEDVNDFLLERLDATTREAMRKRTEKSSAS